MIAPASSIGFCEYLYRRRREQLNLLLFNTARDGPTPMSTRNTSINPHPRLDYLECAATDRLQPCCGRAKPPRRHNTGFCSFSLSRILRQSPIPNHRPPSILHVRLGLNSQFLRTVTIYSTLRVAPSFVGYRTFSTDSVLSDITDPTSKGGSMVV